MEKEPPSYYQGPAIESSPKITPFLNNQVFFITGSTGFLGKVLLCKLLYDCQGLGKDSVYVLVRSKKNQSAEERFYKEVFEDSKIMGPLVAERGLENIKAIIKVVEGDISQHRLGMAPNVYEELQERVTCILHLAATVNFNEHIQLAIEINIFGSQRVMELAVATKKLKALVHTSTCYVNCIRQGNEEIREKMYPIGFDYNKLIDRVMSMTREEAEKATRDIVTPHPNTYTFTKFIAEHMMAEMVPPHLPYAIVRPSIIGASYRFPVPGWVDSYIGPSGLLLAVGMGIVHCMIGRESAICDLIPVDQVVNKILSVCWDIANNRPPVIEGRRPEVPIYQSSSGISNPLRWMDLKTSANSYWARYPLAKAWQRPWAFFSETGIRFRIVHHTLTTVPAVIADAVSTARGGQKKYFRQTRTIERVIKGLNFFTNVSWRFSDHNSKGLYDRMAPADLVHYDSDPRRITWDPYLFYYLEGIRYYLYKEERPASHKFLPHAKL